MSLFSFFAKFSDCLMEINYILMEGIKMENQKKELTEFIRALEEGRQYYLENNKKMHDQDLRIQTANNLSKLIDLYKSFIED